MRYPPPKDLTALRVDTPETEKIFVNQLISLQETSTDKNADWWPFLIKYWKERYENWYITLHGDEVLYFGAVQKLTWDSGIPELNETFYRLMTRTWSGPKKFGLQSGIVQSEMSPAMLALKLMLEDYPEKRNVMTMEYPTRKPTLQKLANKINYWYGGDWKMHDGMYFTCSDYPENRKRLQCWQGIISNYDYELPFDMISTERWFELFGKDYNKRKKGN